MARSYTWKRVVGWSRVWPAPTHLNTRRGLVAGMARSYTLENASWRLLQERAMRATFGRVRR